MDRFEYGLPDPQAQPIALAGYCAAQGCQEEFFLGDEVLQLGNEHFCGARCLAKHLGAEWVGAGMEG